MKWEFYHFSSIDSTNQTARTYPVGSVITADTQTAGRGRYGRTWHSPVGNLYMSIVLPNTEQRAYLPFVMGVAVAQALTDFNVQLKWPNDVLRDGKKICGMLIEAAEDKLIAGIGVNIVSSPENVMYPTTDLGGALSVDVVRDGILNYLDRTLSVLQTQGFSPVREMWLAHACGMGGAVTVRLPHTELHGTFVGIDAQGALILKQEDETRTITAGDVFLI